MPPLMRPAGRSPNLDCRKRGYNGNPGIKKKANEVRRGILTAVHAAKSSHPAVHSPAADIFTYLYFEEMNIDPSRPDMEGQGSLCIIKGP